MSESSMSEALLGPLNELQTLSQTLFLSLSPIQSKPPPPPPLSAFLACDEALSSAVNLAHTHQLKQRKIEALKDEILELDRRWREICTELEAGKRELEEMIEEGEERIKSIEQAKKGCVLLWRVLNASLMFWQPLFRTLNSWHTHKVLVHLLPRRQICPTSRFPVNPRHRCFFHHFPTKRRCAVAASMQRHPWACLGKHILSDEVCPVAFFRHLLIVVQPLLSRHQKRLTQANTWHLAPILTDRIYALLNPSCSIWIWI